MPSDVFSLEPTSQAEVDELVKDGAAFIKRKLNESAAYIPNVQEVFQIAEEQELSEEDKYAVLAYRALVDVMRSEQERLRAAQAAVQPSRIVNQFGEGVVIDHPAPESKLDVE